MQDSNGKGSPSKGFFGHIAASLGARRYDYLGVVILRFFGILSLVSLIISLAIGLLLTVEGGIECFRSGAKIDLFPAEAQRHHAMSTLMDSLEFYFLAPLGYIVLRTLGNYLSEFATELGGFPKRDSLGNLMKVKALSMGLLIAVLATHLVSLFLQSDQDAASVANLALRPGNRILEQFPVKQVLCGVLLLLALLANYWVIEIGGSERERRKNSKEPPDDQLPLGNPPPL